MNGEQLIATCRALAAQQYPEDAEALQRAQYEVELLRTKVLELCKVVAQAEVVHA